MVKYYCDICEKEVKEKEFYSYFHWDAGHDTMDVCKECYEKLKDIEANYIKKDNELRRKFCDEIDKIIEKERKNNEGN